MKDLRTIVWFISSLLTLHVCAGVAWAAELKGTISSTVKLMEDSELVDDVTCAVPLTSPGANPCIVFGANDIRLRLNGHSITGPVDPPTGCSGPTDSMYGVGILASGITGVAIEGPGVIQRFERWGILLLLSTDVTVRHVTVNRNCWSGMQTILTSGSRFEENAWVNNAAGSNGAGCGGICLANSNNNSMRRSTFLGNGSLDYPGGNVDFGIGFEGSSSGNMVEANAIGGNTNGVEFFNTSSGNVVRHNVIAGNPSGQVLKTFNVANEHGADIAFSPSFAGANNTIEDNFCLTYIAGGGPAAAPCPNILVGADE